jgi:phenolic acid decarboxylase
MWDLDTIQKMNQKKPTTPRFIVGEFVKVHYGKSLGHTAQGNVHTVDIDDLPTLIRTRDGNLLALSPRESRTTEKL